MRAALTFQKRCVGQQGLLALVAFAALAVFGPMLLRIESGLAGRVVLRGFLINAGQIALSALLTTWSLRQHRFLLRSLAIGSSAVEESDVASLRAVPRRLLLIHLVAGTVAGLCFLALRPPELASAVADEFVVFGLMTTLATAVPGYVLVQSRVGQLLESSPLDTVTSHLIALSPTGAPRRLSRRNLVFAVVAPLALVGVGGVLASYAHLRAIHDESRETLARMVGEGVIGAGPTVRSSGQNAALRVAEQAGFEVTLEAGPVSTEPRQRSFTREADDNLRMMIPLESGTAQVRYRSELGFVTSFPLAAGAAANLLLAILLSQFLARFVSRDIARASKEMAALGTEAVIKGKRAKREVRFVAVGELLRSLDQLLDRFGVFAAAQERSLEAKEASQRTRGLLFASVSHDLKSPLNAIVGFAESIDTNSLRAEQRESLELISTRGRELVALIETILDAARVDAGQLSLSTSKVDVQAWLTGSTKLAKMLAPAGAEPRVDATPSLTPVLGDPMYLTRAVAIVMAHAMRAPTIDGAPAVVEVTGAMGKKPNVCRVEVRYGATTSVTAHELEARFDQGLAAKGRGLALALGLSRSIVELHRGAVGVETGPGGSPMVIFNLPCVVER